METMELFSFAPLAAIALLLAAKARDLITGRW
jgi:hypothetical protein